MKASLKLAALLVAAVFAGSAVSAVASADSPCTEFGGKVDGQTCRVHTSTDAYTVDMTFPVDYPDAALGDYLKQTRDGFVAVAQMPGSTGLPYSLDVTSESYASAHTQSAVLKIYQNVGGAHPLTWYKAFNYDADTHQPISYDTLFAPGSLPLPVILPIVQHELDQQLGSRVAISIGDGLNPANYQNFAITDDEVIFFFGQDELLPSAAGATVAHVPRTAIAPMLRPPAT